MDSSSELPQSTSSPNPNRVQESPIFSYISNLSPIKPDKAALVVQGFPGINSPPFIFRSCQGKPKGMKSSPERADFNRSSEAAFANVEKTDILLDKSVKSSKDLSSDSSSRPYKTLVTINSVQEKTSSASGNADHLSTIDNMDGSANEMLIIQSPPLVFEKDEDYDSIEGDEDYDSSHSPSSVKTFESVKKSKHHAMPLNACSNIDLNSSGDQFWNNEHGGNVGQRGINRRLQFNESDSEKIATFSFQLSGRRAGDPRFTAGSAEAEVPEPLSLYKPVSASNASIANVQTLFCPQNDINYNIKVPKPSGIGLHLNSLIAKRREGGSFDESGVKSVCVTSCSLHKNEVGDASLSNNFNMCDTTTSIEASAAESSHDVKPVIVKLKIPPQSKDKRKCSSETVDSSGDSVQSNPKKERKIVMNTDDGNGCKRCNCRKTKCLKLYCDCFAAGLYCSEPCACQGCFNRPEYEYAVLKSRQQIESRDPLAFVPKVIQNLNGSPTNVCTDDGDITIFSGRHKRGCNCKKSKCLKKYCECYQANVGCSDGCRCEGCENPHGQKEVVKDWAGRLNHCRSLDPSFRVVPSKGNFVQNEPHTPQDMSPLTPPFQDSIGNEKDTSRPPRVSSEKFLPSSSSDSILPRPSENSLAAATDSDNCDMILETNNEIMDLTPPEQDFTRASPFAPCDEPPGRMPSTSRAQILSANHIPSESSLRWRRSPILPATHLGLGKLQEIAVSEDQLFSTMNDTPEILKEDTLLPTNAVKLSSPNKKRVSPPRGRLLPLGSSSLTGLRTCRRFVLKAVQPMRPTTSCIQSQGNPDQAPANSQSSSSSKQHQ